MTTKRRKFVAMLLLAVIGGGIAYALLNQSHEPKYKGHNLSYWLQEYEWGTAYQHARGDSTGAEVAVRAIGTNALPHLLKWITYEPSGWRSKLRPKLPDSFTRHSSVNRWLEGEAEHQADLAFYGFLILETNAVSAIPQLEAAMKKSTTRETTTRVMFALHGIGGPALPVLRVGLASTNPANRAFLIGNFKHPLRRLESVPVSAYLPLLMDALTNHNLAVREEATNTLQYLAPEVLSNAPLK